MAPGNRYNSGRRLVLSILCIQAICQVTSECDQTFVSRPGNPMNGTFHAPELENPRGHSRNCVYTFLAGPGQRVQLTFITFNLRGRPPDGAAVGDLPACVHEYMDVYAEVVQPKPEELVNTPFGGRYCGPVPPRTRVSLYRALALSYHTDKNETTSDVFTGRYQFINDSEYEIGQPLSGSPCNFLVKGAVKHTGVLLTPTYPGAYPKALHCSYQFLGAPGERIRIEFRDFDLFFGGPHCPFDYVKVYDGLDNTSSIIGTYCGQQRNLVIYSSNSSLLVTFVTLPRTANTQNRGFKGIFEFSNSFTKLDFISKEGEHIKGTECDQKILSKKESSGFLFSPNYPFPYMPKLVCRYFIYGMQDQQHLERVRLEFLMFDVPKAGGKGDCSDGYLKIYLKGQETTDSYDKFDYEICGEESDPRIVVSDGPRMVLVFSSGELMGRGFKAQYTFETEYRIPGTAAPDGTCFFTYRSTSRKRGEFNSPRYPSNYPSNTNCTYLFLATDNEQVTLVFDNFKIRADNVNTSIGSYGTICQEDWIEIYNIYRDGTETKIGRYCHLSAPGPIESNRGAIGLKLILHSDGEGVYSGFKARYSFEVAKSIFGDCGGNVSSLEFGVITSPNYPKDYGTLSKNQASKSCNWYITVRPRYKILLVFDTFALEGEPLGRGCPAAVLRLWNDLSSTPIELCGEKPPGVSTQWQYLSTSNTVRLSFITADKAVGAKGFRAIWTEVVEGPSCDEFQCLQSGFCLPNRLRCNDHPNCGLDDESDEADCKPVEQPREKFKTSWVCAIAAILLALVLLCIICHRLLGRKRRRRRRAGGQFPLPIAAFAVPGPSSARQPPPSPPPPPPPPPAMHFCEEMAERYASSVDSV